MAKLFVCAWVFATAALAATPESLYNQNCAQCHDRSDNPRVPTRATLNALSPDFIQRVLTIGAMSHQGASLTPAERIELARWLGSARGSTVIANPCSVRGGGGPGSWTAWSPALANTRWVASSIDAAKLELQWAYGFPGASMMRSQPAVDNGRVYAGSQDGTVSAIDAQTGCTWWTANVAAEVRTAIVVANGALYFGDNTGVVHAVGTSDGRALWSTRTDDHPAARITGAPVYYRGRLYVPVASSEEAVAMQPGYQCCTFRGSVLALDASTGRIIWKTHTITEPARPLTTKRGTKTLGPSGAAVWSPATIDATRNALYVTTGDNYSDPVTATSDAVLALDLATGKILWWRQFTAGDAMNLSCWQPGKENCPDSDGPDFDFGAPSMLVTLGGNRRALVLGQKSGMVYAIDPDRKGAPIWQYRASDGGVAGGIQWGMAADKKRAYIAVSDMGIKPPAKRVPGGPRYEIDPAKGGGLIALNLADGKLAWRTPAPGCDDRRPCSPAQIAPVTATTTAIYSPSIDGRVRAYSPAEGRILWTFDTVRDFQTANNVPARGGSMDVAGAVIAGDMVFVMSGYNFLGGMPGNVLVAFRVSQ